jgi:nucleoside 2-deoxyribosyltransferase
LIEEPTLIIYLAGPLGFSEAGRFFYYEKLIPFLVARNHAVLDPWRLTSNERFLAVSAMPEGAARVAAWSSLGEEIGKNNVTAITAAELILAVLDGADVDSGTSAEIGYGFALGKRVLGYRSDFRRSGDNEGCVVNLQVEFFIRSSGGTIVSKLEDLAKYL